MLVLSHIKNLIAQLTAMLFCVCDNKKNLEAWTLNSGRKLRFFCQTTISKIMSLNILYYQSFMKFYTMADASQEEIDK